MPKHKTDAATHVVNGKRCLGLHPFVWLFMWVFAIIGFQGTSEIWRAIGLIACLIFFFIKQSGWFISLCRRSSILLVMTGVLFAWRTPGVTLFPVESIFWMYLTPTYEGILVASAHLLSLFIFLALAAFFLTFLTQSQILIGLYRICAWLPFVKAAQFTIRIFLVLEQLNDKNPDHNLKQPISPFFKWVNAENIPFFNNYSEICLQEPVIRLRDWGAVAVSACVMILLRRI